MRTDVRAHARINRRFSPPPLHTSLPFLLLHPPSLCIRFVGIRRVRNKIATLRCHSIHTFLSIPRVSTNIRAYTTSSSPRVRNAHLYYFVQYGNIARILLGDATSFSIQRSRDLTSRFCRISPIHLPEIAVIALRNCNSTGGGETTDRFKRKKIA